MRHGVAGVDTQVEQHLVDLRGIGVQPPQFRRDLHAHLDVLGEGAADEAAELLHQASEIDDLAVAIEAAGEGQHLADQAGAAGGARRHHIKQRPVFLGTAAELEQVGRHGDGRQHVVEVVRDAAGEHADAAHPLRMQKLVFEALLLGDVAPDREETGAGELRRHVFRHPLERPLAPGPAARQERLVLAGLQFTRGRGALQGKADRFARRRRHEVDEQRARQRTPSVLRSGRMIARQRRVGVGDATRGVDAANPVAQGIEHRARGGVDRCRPGRRAGGLAKQPSQSPPRHGRQREGPPHAVSRNHPVGWADQVVLTHQGIDGLLAHRKACCIKTHSPRFDRCLEHSIFGRRP